MDGHQRIGRWVIGGFFCVCFQFGFVGEQIAVQMMHSIGLHDDFAVMIFSHEYVWVERTMSITRFHDQYYVATKMDLIRMVDMDMMGDRGICGFGFVFFL